MAGEFAAAYEVAGRLECLPGDMFRDAVPADCEVVLLSNILHDWDVPECRTLIRALCDALLAGGRLVIHDVSSMTRWTARYPWHCTRQLSSP